MKSENYLIVFVSYLLAWAFCSCFLVVRCIRNAYFKSDDRYGSNIFPSISGIICFLFAFLPAVGVPVLDYAYKREIWKEMSFDGVVSSKNGHWIEIEGQKDARFYDEWGWMWKCKIGDHVRKKPEKLNGRQSVNKSAYAPTNVIVRADFLPNQPTLRQRPMPHR